MRISNLRVLLLSAPIPPERRWTSDFGTNPRQERAIPERRDERRAYSFRRMLIANRGVGLA